MRGGKNLLLSYVHSRKSSVLAILAKVIVSYHQEAPHNC